MNVQAFIDKYNGKGIDFDGFYGYQCMDLYQQYTKEVVGGPHVPAPAAANVWDSYSTNHYERIANSPDNCPQPGDVVIWKKAASLPYGHIAIAVDANANSFTSFDQNWPEGSLCHLQAHKYTNVAGWLRPKTQVTSTTTTVFQFTDQTKIPLAPYGDIEIQALRGLLTDLKYLREENPQLKTRISELEGEVKTLTSNLIDTRKALKKAENPAPVAKDDTTITPGKTIEVPPFLAALVNFLKKFG